MMPHPQPPPPPGNNSDSNSHVSNGGGKAGKKPPQQPTQPKVPPVLPGMGGMAGPGGVVPGSKQPVVTNPRPMDVPKQPHSASPMVRKADSGQARLAGFSGPGAGSAPGGLADANATTPAMSRVQPPPGGLVKRTELPPGAPAGFLGVAAGKPTSQPPSNFAAQGVRSLGPTGPVRSAGPGGLRPGGPTGLGPHTGPGGMGTQPGPGGMAPRNGGRGVAPQTGAVGLQAGPQPGRTGAGQGTGGSRPNGAVAGPGQGGPRGPPAAQQIGGPPGIGPKTGMGGISPGVRGAGATRAGLANHAPMRTQARGQTVQSATKPLSHLTGGRQQPSLEERRLPPPEGGPQMAGTAAAAAVKQQQNQLQPPAGVVGPARHSGLPVQHPRQQQVPSQHQPPPAMRSQGPPAPQQSQAQQQNHAGFAGPSMGGGGMRELRVEDALLYLDDVKREFGDRPRVYNEFLSIMKNFKSQEVDTPGVIARVSHLFRGYNNLILGFNKFLPDGYKISLEELERQDAEIARQKALEEQQLKNRQEQLGVGSMHNSHPNAASGPPAQQQRMFRFNKPAQGADARAGTDSTPSATVPNAASTSPVSGVPRSGPVVGRPVASGHTGPQGKGSRGETSPDPKIGMGTAAVRQEPSGVGGVGQLSETIGPPSAGKMQAQRTPPQQQSSPQQRLPASQQQPPPQQHQAVEFDHAISYVTTIKRRFANDPSTYHAFLEILHTYQKEQRGIKEVLEQVAHLFQDHPDLLKEFTFFLPDAVQEQAKERLHRAAADSEARQAAQRQALEQHSRQQKQGQQADYRVQGGRASATGHQKFIDMTSSQMASAEVEAASRGRKRPFSAAVEQANQVAPVAITPPETYIYNSAVERQFFDAARDALTSFTRDGGQAWAEFLKCLDMYAQDVLSRSEMLNLVEPLLGKRNTKLFEEFKRILAAAGSQSGPTPSMEDSWYSVPLSEIDFSRCRRCSPSYRALPRDYPAPPCSGRSEEEAKALNDVWVSLPVGSEESYTFRHMRRNTYEEILFRCEDERFEIDMVIDSNAATLHRLKPIAEEIAQLSVEEMVTSDVYSGDVPPSEGAGLGGKRFQYSFDKCILGVIHRNAIARIYGDAGQEMLELIVKNPTVAVPLVVNRLTQKDKEWRAVRDRLNRRWKDLAEHNYYRSLDHRSLTWRTTDKRATSTRTLLSEIKDRASNGGNEGKAALQARMEKAKEEHGSFYEVTMRDALSVKLDLTNLPKPDRRIFTPHLSLEYENNSWAQRDAYRILSLALERGAISPGDKERCHRLWLEFLGPWFGLALNWMQRPAVSYQESSRNEAPVIVSNGEESPGDDDDESMEDADLGDTARVVTEERRDRSHAQSESDSVLWMDYHPLPPGATVSTLLGEGKVVDFRRSDKTYVVTLSFGGTAYLRPSAVLCSILPVEKSSYTDQLRGDDRSTLDRSTDLLGVGTQHLYLFFRLHQILVRRLGIARDLAYEVPKDGSLSTLVEQMEAEGGFSVDVGRRRYDAYLGLVYALIDGGSSTLSSSGAAEGGKYEDRVRCLLGHGGYELATMDKLISHILKNLQSIANDETMWNLIGIFRRHLDSGSFKPEAFRQEAAFLSDGEALYAFQHCPVPGKDSSVLYTEYLGVISEAEDGASVDMELSEEPPLVATKRPRRS